jgi:hypothetical protein
MQGRYGQSRNISDGWGSDGVFASTFNLTTANGTVVTANATTTPILRESHWQADGGVGYDFMRGAQINFGFRVAEIKSDIDFNTGFNLSIPTAGGAPVGVVATATIYERDRRSFLGAGPRIGIGGSVPIMGPLVFDYTADAAVLFGNTKWSTGQVVGVGVNVPGAFAFSLTGLGLNQATWSSNITVYNFDVEGGLGWWLTPNWKISATYRLDAFIDPLRTAPDDGANAGVGLLGGGTNIGPGRSLDRFYHGPKLAVEGRF